MSRSAKELCGMFITRQLASLTEEEEDVVVDYLEDIGIEVDIDITPRELCLALLSKTMEEDLGKVIPMTAYANQIVGKEKKLSFEKEIEKEQRELVRKRKSIQKTLRNKNKKLPGCVLGQNKIIPDNLFTLRVDDTLGITTASDGSSY